MSKDKPLFGDMSTEGMKVCMEANQVDPKDRHFKNPVWAKHYSNFCRATSYRDKTPEHFGMYVKYWKDGLDVTGYTRIERGTKNYSKNWHRFTKTRMMTPLDTTTKANLQANRSPFEDFYKNGNTMQAQSDFNKYVMSGEGAPAVANDIRGRIQQELEKTNNDE
tara:strand:- start:2401 stop:2892 length:492 start_codon:yes stop_codon:yes gene_type:complete